MVRVPKFWVLAGSQALYRSIINAKIGKGYGAWATTGTRMLANVDSPCSCGGVTNRRSASPGTGWSGTGISPASRQSCM